MVRVKTILLLTQLLLSCIALWAQDQPLDVSYARELHQKYPSVRSDLCPSCKLWENPYFKSIADTAAHMPLVTFYIYTREHRLQQEALGLDRKGLVAAWNPSHGQPDETLVYRAANRAIGKPNSPEVIAKGHCQPWILLGWCVDAAILSNTYIFNAAMEYQGQNVGTQLASEEHCRKLTGFKGETLTDSVRIWCGAALVQQAYRQGSISIAVPEAFYKILSYRLKSTGEQVLECYWMPNRHTEKRDKFPERKIAFEALVARLGFDPTIILQ